MWALKWQCPPSNKMVVCLDVEQDVKVTCKEIMSMKLLEKGKLQPWGLHMLKQNPKHPRWVEQPWVLKRQREAWSSRQFKCVFSIEIEKEAGCWPIREEYRFPSLEHRVTSSVNGRAENKTKLKPLPRGPLQFSVGTAFPRSWYLKEDTYISLFW